ncbi:MAG: ATP-binding protein [Granulosicoccus sp.]
MKSFFHSIRQSLQYRLIAVLLFSLLVLMSATIVTTYQATSHEMDEILDGQMVMSGRALFSIIVLGLKDGGAEEIPTLLDRYVRLRQGGGDWTNQLPHGHIYDQEYYFQLVDPTGATIFSSQKPPLLDRSDQTTGFLKVEKNDNQWHVFGLKDASSQYTFYTGQSTNLRNQLSRESAEYITFPFILGMPIILIALWFGIGIGLKPIAWITRELDARKPDNIEPLKTDTTVTELRPLVEAMNRLFDRVSAMLENERRFSADASHELRTPLAGMKANIDAARFFTDDPGLAKIHNNIERGVDNAIHITEGLLLLSKLESGHADDYLENDTIDLDHVVTGEIAKLNDLHPEQNNRIVFSTTCGGDRALVKGSTSLARALIFNILDNAIRYSSAPDNVLVDLSADERVMLTIADAGPGIPVDEQPNVFQRFYRLDTNTASGSGLGLALSRQIAESMGGTLVIENRMPTGLLVTMCFPTQRQLHSGTNKPMTTQPTSAEESLN